VGEIQARRIVEHFASLRQAEMEEAANADIEE
jgi:hypothetical protein